MAVDDLWYFTKKNDAGERVPSGRHGRGKRYRVRYVDPDGKTCQRLFEKKGDADRYDVAMRGAVDRGDYVDPGTRRITLREYAEQWRTIQPHRDSTADRTRLQLAKHIYPALGSRPVAAIRRSEVQAFVSGLDMAPSSARTVFSILRAIITAAIQDRIISYDPCFKIGFTELPVTQLIPLTVEQVETLADAIGPLYRALVLFGAATGLRQGELFGLQVADVEFLRKTMTVQRQVQVQRGGGTATCPLKTRSSFRTLPLGETPVDALAAHLKAYPAKGAEFIFRDEHGRALHKGRFDRDVWVPARTAAGLPEATCHDLRHFYASALIRGGLNAKVVAERLGHANAAMTWKVYAHLWPDDEDRSRQAIDDVFRRPAAEHDRLRSVP